MPRLGLIIASALTLASLVAIGGEAGVLPLRDLLLSIPLTEHLGGDGTRPIANDDAFSFQDSQQPKGASTSLLLRQPPVQHQLGGSAGLRESF